MPFPPFGLVGGLFPESSWNPTSYFMWKMRHGLKGTPMTQYPHPAQMTKRHASSKLTSNLANQTRLAGFLGSLESLSLFLRTGMSFVRWRSVPFAQTSRRLTRLIGSLRESQFVNPLDHDSRVHRSQILGNECCIFGWGNVEAPPQSHLAWF